MEKYGLVLTRYFALFLISLSVLHDLSVCVALHSTGTGNIFSEDFFVNQEVMLHANCHNELPALEFQNSGLFVTYYDFNLGTMGKMESLSKHKNLNSLFIFICPSNVSKVNENLKEIYELSMKDIPFSLNKYIIQWPVVSEGLETFLTILRDESILNIIKSYPMNIDVYLSVNYYIQRNNHSPSTDSDSISSALIELYSVNMYVPVIQTIWDSFISGKILYDNMINKVARRWNFYAAPVRGVYTTVDRDDNEVNVVQPRLFFEGISKAFNFSLITTKSAGWITKRTSNDTGKYPLLYMGEQILSGEADISIQNSEILMYRAKYLHITPRIYPNRLFVILRQPPASLVRNIYIKAFHMEVWLIYSVIWIIFIALVYAALTIKRRYHLQRENILHTNTDSRVRDREYIIQETQVWFMATLTNRGINTSPSTLSLKIIRFSCLVMVIMCYTFYASSLYSILSHQRGPITSYDDLEKSNIPVVGDNRALRGLEVLTELYNNRGYREEYAKEKFVDPFIAAAMMVTSAVAVISEKETWYRLEAGVSDMTIRHICQLFSEFDINLGPNLGSGPHMHRNSSMRKLLTYPIFILIENGIVFREVRILEQASTVFRCPHKHQEVPAMGNNDVFTVYIVLGMGMITSLLVLLKEKKLALANKNHVPVGLDTNKFDLTK